MHRSCAKCALATSGESGSVPFEMASRSHNGLARLRLKRRIEQRLQQPKPFRAPRLVREGDPTPLLCRFEVQFVDRPEDRYRTFVPNPPTGFHIDEGRLGSHPHRAAHDDRFVARSWLESITFDPPAARHIGVPPIEIGHVGEKLEGIVRATPDVEMSNESDHLAGSDPIHWAGPGVPFDSCRLQSRGPH